MAAHYGESELFSETKKKLRQQASPLNYFYLALMAPLKIVLSIVSLAIARGGM